MPASNLPMARFIFQQQGLKCLSKKSFQGVYKMDLRTTFLESPNSKALCTAPYFVSKKQAASPAHRPTSSLRPIILEYSPPSLEHYCLLTTCIRPTDLDCGLQCSTLVLQLHSEPGSESHCHKAKTLERFPFKPVPCHKAHDKYRKCEQQPNPEAS